MNIINFILSFKSYVMLPIFMFILSMIIRIKVKTALKSCITIGIGFIGIFIVFDFFASKIGPIVEAIVKRTGLNLNVLDVGWPPLAGITWSFKFAAPLILIIIIVNIVMLVLKLTSTVNIDIWNYWHFIFAAQITYEITGNLLLGIMSAIFVMIICIKLADWSAEEIGGFLGISGVSITTLSGIVYYPIGVVFDKLLDKVPFLNKIKADPKEIQDKLGIFGESMIIGFIMGIFLAIFAGYNIKDTLELAFNIAAVVYILPKMASILGEGLMPISDGAKEYIINRFPTMKKSYIGLDLAIVLGNPSVIVTGILLMPVALILAFVLPGIRFIPIGDLPNIIALASIIVVGVRGNIVRAFIASIPVIIGNLYLASYMADTYTKLAERTNFHINGYNGIITSFLDGGNLLRVWAVKLFGGNIFAFAFVPLVVYFLYLSRKRAYEK